MVGARLTALMLPAIYELLRGLRSSPLRSPPAGGWNMKFWISIFLLAAVVGVIWYSGILSDEGNSGSRNTTEKTRESSSSSQGTTEKSRANSYSSQGTTEKTRAPSPPPKPAFNEPQLPLPPNGEVQYFTQQPAIAPFGIETAPGNDNYLVKLEDANSGLHVLDVFVRGGSNIEVNVPLGTYVVKYAAGTNWYGYEHYFGPDATYSKADELFYFWQDDFQVHGNAITLYQVVGGNLETSEIEADGF